MSSANPKSAFIELMSAQRVPHSRCQLPDSAQTLATAPRAADASRALRNVIIGKLQDGLLRDLDRPHLAMSREVLRKGGRLQVQERLTHQVADTVQETLEPTGVAVVMEGRHMCMQMRGVAKQNSFTTTSAMLGQFRKSNETRAEFLSFIGK